MWMLWASFVGYWFEDPFDMPMLEGSWMLRMKITGNAPCKQEFPCKLRGWHSKRKFDHMHCVSDMQGEGVSTCNMYIAGWRRCDHDHLRERPEKYITKEISTRKRLRWGKQFTDNLYRQSLCVHLSRLRLYLTVPVPTFWVIKGNEMKLIISSYMSVVVFLFYTKLLGLFGFYGLSILVGYLMPKTFLWIYLQFTRFYFVWFCGISTLVDYLMLNPLYTYISNIYDLAGLGFMAYQPL